MRGHVGTNIVANSRFNEDDASGNPDFDRDRMAKMFKAKDASSRATEIILSGVKRKKRIFVGLDAVLMDVAQRITNAL